MKITADSVRNKYPNPGAIGNPGCTYCVGGAFILFVGGNIPFPVSSTIREYLILQNPRLSRPHAGVVAENILRANDSGYFDRAWRYLDEALKFGDISSSIHGQLIDNLEKAGIVIDSMPETETESESTPDQQSERKITFREFL